MRSQWFLLFNCENERDCPKGIPVELRASQGRLRTVFSAFLSLWFYFFKRQTREIVPKGFLWNFVPRNDERAKSTHPFSFKQHFQGIIQSSCSLYFPFINKINFISIFDGIQPMGNNNQGSFF